MLTIEKTLAKIKAECPYLTGSYSRKTGRFCLIVNTGSKTHQYRNAVYFDNRVDALLNAILMQATEHKRMQIRFNLVSTVQFNGKPRLVRYK